MIMKILINLLIIVKYDEIFFEYPLKSYEYLIKNYEYPLKDTDGDIIIEDNIDCDFKTN